MVSGQVHIFFPKKLWKIPRNLVDTLSGNVNTGDVNPHLSSPPSSLCRTLSPLELSSKQTLNTSFQQPAAHREGDVRWYFWWKHSFLRQTWQHNTLPSFLWHFNLPLSSQVAQRRSCSDLMLSSAFPTYFLLPCSQATNNTKYISWLTNPAKKRKCTYNLKDCPW